MAYFRIPFYGDIDYEDRDYQRREIVEAFSIEHIGSMVLIEKADDDAYRISFELSDLEIYLEKEDFISDIVVEDGKPVICFVSDVYVENSEEEYNVLFYIKVDVSEEMTYEQSNIYIDIKNQLEKQFADLYLNLDRDIMIPTRLERQSHCRDNAIPTRLERQRIVAKMMFSLKGKCTFEECDRLTMIKNKILKEKYSNYLETNIAHPGEINDNDRPPKEVVYEFPKQIKKSDIIELMGQFSVDKNDQRTIKICDENIEETVIQCCDDRQFKKNIVKAVNAYSNYSSNYKPYDEIFNMLKEMVVKHELGHMVFRSINNELEDSKKESLANWVSCLFAEDIEREMKGIITTFQSEKYHEFIRIPAKYKLTEIIYSEYCDKIEDALEAW